jgi:tetratricopeptide (TPR) repeat protein
LDTKISIHTEENIKAKDWDKAFLEAPRLLSKINEIIGQNDFSIESSEPPNNGQNETDHGMIPRMKTIPVVATIETENATYWSWREKTLAFALCFVISVVYLTTVKEQKWDVSSLLQKSPLKLSSMFSVPQNLPVESVQNKLPPTESISTEPTKIEKISILDKLKTNIPKKGSLIEQMRFANVIPPSDSKIERYKAVIEHHPYSISALWAEAYIAETMIELGRHSQAREVLTELQDKLPLTELNLEAEIHFLLGLSHMEEKNYDQAEQEFRIVLERYSNAHFQSFRSEEALRQIKGE